MKTTPLLRALAYSMLLLGAAACTSRRTAGDVSPEPAATANVFLNLSDEGDRAVAMTVLVDGQVMIRRTIPSLYRDARAHGTPDVFPLELSPGRHTIRVVSEGGKTTAETQIAVSERPLHVSATYWPGEQVAGVWQAARVEIVVQDHPFGWC